MTNIINISPKKLSSQQGGFSLIEILVSIIIVSIGLLGIVRMQVSNIKNTNDSKLRSQAVQLTQNMVDRMRANIDQVVAGNYDVAFNGSLSTTTNCTNGSADCNPTTMATYDVTSWLCQLGDYNSNSMCTTLGLQGTLPSGQGRIAYNTANGTTTVSVRWKGQADKANFIVHSMSTRL